MISGARAVFGGIQNFLTCFRSVDGIIICVEPLCCNAYFGEKRRSLVSVSSPRADEKPIAVASNCFKVTAKVGDDVKRKMASNLHLNLSGTCVVIFFKPKKERMMS